MPEKDFSKVLDLADDLRLVADAGRKGTTRDVLEVVHDDVGLGAAMSLLDRTGGGQGSSHLDDLEGLLGVADLHPDPATFEAWLRDVFQHEAHPSGVTLSTIHRVKGPSGTVSPCSAWPTASCPTGWPTMTRRSAGYSTSASHEAGFVSSCSPTARGAAPSSTSSPAPHRSGRHARGSSRHAGSNTPRLTPPAASSVTSKPASKAAASAAGEGIAANEGVRIKVLGGYEGVVESLGGHGATIRLDTGGSLAVRFGERVETDGRRAPLTIPDALWGAAARAEQALRTWRTQHAPGGRRTGLCRPERQVPPRGCRGEPGDGGRPRRVDGIGPAKLEKYADEILDVLSGVPAPTE